MQKIFLKETALDKALEIWDKFLKSEWKKPENFEEIETPMTSGFYAYESIYANNSSPFYVSSAMDGLATLSKVSSSASKTNPVLIEIKPPFKMVNTGENLQGLEIDCVIPVEDLIFKNENTVEIRRPFAPFENIRMIGEDVEKGSLVVEANKKITPFDVGLLLASGIEKVKVKKRIKVGIIPTGDEIKKITDDIRIGDIIDTNSDILASLVKEWDGEPTIYPITPNDIFKLEKILKIAEEENDIILLIAGSSKGKKDFSYNTISKVGDLLVHGILIQPGKPTILSKTMNTKPLIGVPGFPASCILIAYLFLKPVLFSYYNKAFMEEKIETTIKRDISSNVGIDEFIRVKLGMINSEVVAIPMPRGASLISSFKDADGYIRVDKNTEGIEEGEQIKVNLIKNREDFKNDVIFIGSNDPLLERLKAIVALKNPTFRLFIMSAGSLGGIFSLRKKETNFSAIHLLDSETGAYNIPYIKKYLESVPVYLINLCYREQGLLVKKGNPKNITLISDLLREDITFINRQKGAGTRILLDYILEKEGIDKLKIQGYKKEEYTHLGVANNISLGIADTGLGIKSVANILGLDFIKIADEEYDFVVPQTFFEDPRFQFILEIINSSEFKSEALKLSGYSLKDSSKIIYKNF